ncbi:MAG: hypothetical protein HUU08_00040 [Candidatus Brocadia sp.]|nr:hypothetical protein [Candidatus Brocadia sp.]
MNRLTVFLTLVVCILCFGCKTISTSVTNIDIDTSSRDIKTLAVMRFDDKLIQDKEVTGFFMKTMSNPDAGEMLADMMTHELSKWDKYEILPRSEVRDKIRGGGDEEEELVRRGDYKALGKLLKVDAVIMGKIRAFDLSRMIAYERGDVSFTAECIDTQNGKVLWFLEVNETAPYKDEIEVAGKVIRDAVERLKKEAE